MLRVANKVHTAAKLDVAIQNQAVGDITNYVEGTKAARAQLGQATQNWKVHAK